MEGPFKKECAEKAYIAEKYMSQIDEDAEEIIFDKDAAKDAAKDSAKEAAKEVTNEEIMEKLNTIEYLIIEMAQAQVQLKKDTTKMSEHINTVDAVMSKMPMSWLGGLSFKLLKP